VTGRLVRREDALGLAEAIIEAAVDPNRRAAWGEAGRRRVAERFGLERMVAEYRRVCLDRSNSRNDDSDAVRSSSPPRAKSGMPGTEGGDERDRCGFVPSPGRSRLGP
jgi:hypothetical protein